MNATIKDIARRAGVSDKTVSRVVNGEANVRPETRQLVQSLIDELDYVPNQAARLMRVSKSSVIGVLTDVVSTSPNSVDILRGIQDCVGKTDHSVLIANSGADPEMEQRVWRTFQQHRIDGVIYVTMFHHGVSFDFAAPPRPMVLANCTADTHPDLPAVVPDDYQGGFDAASIALARGHSRIAFLTLNPLIRAAELRGKAFQDVLKSAGISPELCLVEPAFDGPVGQEQLVAYDKAIKVLSVGAEQRPTAILCGNDEVALQVICAANALGISVPNELAVIGFDDFRLISTRVVPSLTTVALPYYEIGMRAAERLMKIISGEPDTAGTERIACPVVERQSA